MHHWTRSSLVGTLAWCHVTCHGMNKWLSIVSWTRKIFSIIYHFFQENLSENIVCAMAFISFRIWWTTVYLPKNTVNGELANSSISWGLFCWHVLSRLKHGQVITFHSFMWDIITHTWKKKVAYEVCHNHYKRLVLSKHLGEYRKVCPLYWMSVLGTCMPETDIKGRDK